MYDVGSGGNSSRVHPDYMNTQHSTVHECVQVCMSKTETLVR